MSVAPGFPVSPEHTGLDGFYFRYVVPSILEEGEMSFALSEKSLDLSQEIES